MFGGMNGANLNRATVPSDSPANGWTLWLPAMEDVPRGGLSSVDGRRVGEHADWGSELMVAPQWGFFEYIPVDLQDSATKDVLMVQYMTEEGLRLTLDERSMWLWSPVTRGVLHGGPAGQGLRPVRAASEMRSSDGP